jgi:hypothetical protein
VTAMPRDLARKQPAEVTVHRPAVINGEVKRTRSRGDVSMATVWKLLAFLLLAFGMAGYVLASLQTI